MNTQTAFDRFLHRFALQSSRFRKFCFKRECERNGFVHDRNRRNLFIAGVPRSGSTALLETIYASGAFASTTYAMMPFVLAPSFAGILPAIRANPTRRSERFHGDGIALGLESPEALDGLFWETWLGPFDGSLSSPELPEDRLQDYSMFIENLLRTTPANRYLSKMNQRFTLLGSLAAYFEKSCFLIPFRDPLQQSRSLLRQHLNFSGLSGYQKTYLEWLGHHEFGATHRGLREPGAPAQEMYSPEQQNYWLQQWKLGYSYLSAQVSIHPNLVPVCYETMAQSSAFWTRLSARLDIDVNGDLFRNCNDDREVAEADIDDSLYDECRLLYRELSTRSEAGLCVRN